MEIIYCVDSGFHYLQAVVVLIAYNFISSFSLVLTK